MLDIKIKYLIEKDSRTFTALVVKFWELLEDGQEVFENKLESDYGCKIIDAFHDFTRMLDLAILAAFTCAPIKDDQDHITAVMVSELQNEFCAVTASSIEMIMEFETTNYKYSGIENLTYPLIKLRLYILSKKFFNVFRVFPENVKIVYGSEFSKAIKTKEKELEFERVKSMNYGIEHM